MKTDSESGLQLDSSEFEAILMAIEAFQNQCGPDTRLDYSEALENIIARIRK